MTRLRHQLLYFQGIPESSAASSLYFKDVPRHQTAMEVFAGALATFLPLDCTLQWASTGNVIEDTTGKPVGTWSDIPIQPAIGATNDKYYAGAGACITWHTSDYVNGRSVKGRTFLVPVSASIFTLQGLLDQTAVNTLVAACATFIQNTAGDFVVYARPFEGRTQIGQPGNPGYVKPIDPRTGSSHEVKTAVVHLQGASLRSRRGT